MWTETKLDQMLSEPSQKLVEDMKKIKGDILILGAGGKIGPNLALMATRAAQKAGVKKRIIAVSRFSDKIAADLLTGNGVEIISLDLMETGAMEKLPDAENIIFMAGKKFGTDGNEYATWWMNAGLPTLVARRFKGSNIVVFSTGNVYPMAPVHSGGCIDSDKPQPVGEYAMSSLARERIFEAAAHEYDSKILIYRLNYAVDLRYGVLYDMADKIIKDEPISLTATCFNCVWQGYVNEIAIRSLLHTDKPVNFLNITGPETVSVRYAATMLGKLLDKAPIFEGQESNYAYLNNSSKCFDLFGYPEVSLSQMIRWQAEWLQDGGRVLNKPTHFEERKGNF